ncbi:hypothetical protein D3C85_1050940 [compost metagenome]
MAVGVVDGFEMVDVDQGDRSAFLLAVATLELDLQLVLPGAMVQQACQAVGAAQCQQFTLLTAQSMGLAEADPAQRQRIQAQQRQTGIELHRAGGRNERRGENQQANAHAQDLRGCPGQ